MTTENQPSPPPQPFLTLHEQIGQATDKGFTTSTPKYQATFDAEPAADIAQTIGPNLFLVLTLLAFLARPSPYGLAVKHGRRRLQDITGLSRTTLTQRLAELVELGYIDRIQTQAPGRRFGDQYIVLAFAKNTHPTPTDEYLLTPQITDDQNPGTGAATTRETGDQKLTTGNKPASHTADQTPRSPKTQHRPHLPDDQNPGTGKNHKTAGHTADQSTGIGQNQQPNEHDENEMHALGAAESTTLRACLLNWGVFDAERLVATHPPKILKTLITAVESRTGVNNPGAYFRSLHQHYTETGQLPVIESPNQPEQTTTASKTSTPTPPPPTSRNTNPTEPELEDFLSPLPAGVRNELQAKAEETLGTKIPTWHNLSSSVRQRMTQATLRELALEWFTNHGTQGPLP